MDEKMGTQTHDGLFRCEEFICCSFPVTGVAQILSLCSHFANAFIM